MCNFTDFWYFSKKITLNNNATKVAISSTSDCDVLTSVIETNNGNTLFSGTFITAGSDAGQTIISDISNNFISSGLLNYGSNNPSNSPATLLWKIDNNNTNIFQNTYNYQVGNDFGKLVCDSSGNIYSYGIAYNGSSNFHVLYKFNPAGNLQWSNSINDYDWFYGYPGRMTLDPSGNAIFTAKRQTSGSPSTYDIVIRKVDPNGNQLWQIYYDLGEDYVYDLTSDATGNIYFTMESRNVEERLVKLDGSSGAVIWSTQYTTGTGNNGKLKINANGNILVGGYPQSKAFDPISGTSLWTSNTIGYNIDNDSNSKIYSVWNDKIYILNGNGSLSDSITVSIPNYTVTLRDIVVSGNVFYVTGKRVNGSDSKIFVAKYSFCNNQNALITANGPTTFCDGENVTLSASSGSSYLWSDGATTQNIIANQSGNYTVSVTDLNGCVATATQTVTVNQLPVVSISSLPQFVNINSAPINVAGLPNGGNTSGDGVVNNQFNPVLAGLGTSQLTYSYTDNNNCSNTTSTFVIVYDTTGTVCTTYDTITTSLSVTDTLVINAVISSVNPPNNVNTVLVYPNPANTHITIDNGNFALMNGYTVRINNALGQTVFSQQVTQQQFFIDLSTWSGPGLYYLDLIDNLGTTINSKVIVIQ